MALRPFLTTVAAAVAVLVAVSVTTLSQRSGTPPEDLGAGSPEPIELLALAHARQGDLLLPGSEAPFTVSLPDDGRTTKPAQ